ncbi:MAG: hypothetical protein ACYDHP_13760 [Ferrimicrobium sp.]
MAIELTTKDCEALSDADLQELSRLGDLQGVAFDVGFLSKQREEWVLASLATENNELLAGMMFTLERIGGTPCVLINLLATKPTDEEQDLLFGLLREAYARALLAFPDEDVLVGVKMVSANGYEMFTGLEDIVPRPEHRPTGEERAWARRLAKRFGLDSGLDDRSSLACGQGTPFGIVVYKLEQPITGGFACIFDHCKPTDGEAVIVFGWAMAERLADGSLPELELDTID